MRSRILLGVVTCILWTVILTSADAVPRYTITDLGTMGEEMSFAYDINDAGHVVGFVSQNWDARGFLYTSGAGMIDLCPSADRSEAYAINNVGQVAGEWWTSLRRTAFVYTPGVGFSYLGTLGGYDSTATDINDAGQVIGYSQLASHAWRAFVYTPGVGMVDLGILPGSYASFAQAINNAGHVVGTSGNRAFLYTPDDGMVDLGTLGGGWSAAWDINGSGQVVGDSEIAGGDVRAFVYTPGLGMRDLGTPGLCCVQDVYAFGTNDSGWVVGQAYGYMQFPFLYIPGSGMIDVNRLIDDRPGDLWVEWVSAVNNSGQIVGWGGYWDLQGPHALLLTPIPTMRVEIDVKPGEDPNCINLKSKGSIPIAVLSTPDFDALTIDIQSVTLGFSSRGHAWWGWEDVDRDGDTDVVLHFRTSALPDREVSGAITLSVNGTTADGHYFEGTDEVIILSHGSR